jgi:hypothetical protein
MVQGVYNKDLGCKEEFLCTFLEDKPFMDFTMSGRQPALLCLFYSFWWYWDLNSGPHTC